MDASAKICGHVFSKTSAVKVCEYSSNSNRDLKHTRAGVKLLTDMCLRGVLDVRINMK